MRLTSHPVYGTFVPIAHTKTLCLVKNLWPHIQKGEKTTKNNSKYSPQEAKKQLKSKEKAGDNDEKISMKIQHKHVREKYQ